MKPRDHAERGSGAEAAERPRRDAVGALIDNEQMEVEGRAKELKGEARQKLNK